MLSSLGGKDRRQKETDGEKDRKTLKNMNRNIFFCITTADVNAL